MKKLEFEIKRRCPIYQFAGECKINLPRCIGIAKGRIQPNLKEIDRIAGILKITSDDVLSWIGEEV